MMIRVAPPMVMRAMTMAEAVLIHQGVTYVYPYVVDCTLAART